MPMRLHELHPTLIHAPLGLLPVAAGVDLAGAFSRDRTLHRAGRMLWGLGVGGGLLAGAAGLAATQEVKVTDKHVNDAMLVHGLGNVIITLAAASLWAWRRRNPPTLASALIGLTSVGAAVFTGWLGGELVYARGVGVQRMAAAQGEGVQDSPELFSREGPRRLVRDMGAGLKWAVAYAAKIARGQERLDSRSLAIGY
jgi:uncharacterized membrane protein